MMKTIFLHICLICTLLVGSAALAWADLTLGVAPGDSGGMLTTEQALQLAQSLSRELDEPVGVRELPDTAQLVNWLNRFAQLDLALLRSDLVNRRTGEFLVLGAVDPAGQISLVARQGVAGDLPQRVGQFLLRTATPIAAVAEVTPVVVAEPPAITEEPAPAVPSEIADDVPDTAPPHVETPTQLTEAEPVIVHVPAPRPGKAWQATGEVTQQILTSQQPRQQKLVLGLVPAPDGLVRTVAQGEQLAGLLEETLQIAVKVQIFDRHESLTDWFRRYQMIDLALLRLEARKDPFEGDYQALVRLFTTGIPRADAPDLMVMRKDLPEDLFVRVQEGLTGLDSSPEGRALLAELQIAQIVPPGGQEARAVEQAAVAEPELPAVSEPVIEPPPVEPPAVAEPEPVAEEVAVAEPEPPVVPEPVVESAPEEPPVAVEPEPVTEEVAVAEPEPPVVPEPVVESAPEEPPVAVEPEPMTEEVAVAVPEPPVVSDPAIEPTPVEPPAVAEPEPVVEEVVVVEPVPPVVPFEPLVEPPAVSEMIESPIEKPVGLEPSPVIRDPEIVEERFSTGEVPPVAADRRRLADADLMPQDEIAKLLGSTPVPESIAQPDLPLQLRPPGIPVPRPGLTPKPKPTPASQPEPEDNLLVAKLTEPIRTTPKPKSLLPPAEPEPQVIYVVPFVAVMVPDVFQSHVFDTFFEALLERSEALGYEFKILKGGLNRVDPEWLAVRKYVTGEIFGYVEDSGCCSTDLRSQSRMTLHLPSTQEPPQTFTFPSHTFFEHDRSSIDVERLKMAEQVASNLVGELVTALNP